MTNSAKKHSLIIGLILVSIVGLLLMEPIPQDSRYHEFADTRSIIGIPNFANVVSNSLFILVGLWGLTSGFKSPLKGVLPGLEKAGVTLFLGLVFTGLGSAYYHWLPNHSSLVWDRLPMTIVFMSLFAMVVGEQVSTALAQKIHGPLLILGVFSVAYWHFTERKHMGDLRLYLLVQFLPVLLIPMLLLLFSSPFTSTRAIWIAIACYIAAKAAELNDAAIFRQLSLISGHSVKHLFAALGSGCILWALLTRQRVSATRPLASA